jgi:hypothetical protein
MNNKPMRTAFYSLVEGALTIDLKECGRVRVPCHNVDKLLFPLSTKSEGGKGRGGFQNVKEMAESDFAGANCCGSRVLRLQ